MPKSRFVTAWSKATGKKQRIPISWVNHPVLGVPFTTTEPTASPAGAPSGAEGDVTPPAESTTTTTKATTAAKGK